MTLDGLLIFGLGVATGAIATAMYFLKGAADKHLGDSELLPPW